MHSRSLLVITVSLIAGGGIVVGLLEAPRAAAPRPVAPATATATASAPVGVPAAMAAPVPVAAPAQVLSGDVLERLDAGSYVYLRLRPEDGAEAWIVLPAREAPAAGAAFVRVRVMRRAERFHSRRLGREFPVLLFAARDAAHRHDATPSSPKGVR